LAAAFADFSGLQVNGVDAKGRVSVPATFRQMIERRFKGLDLHGDELRTIKMSPSELGCIEVVDATYIAEVKDDVMAEAEAEAGGDRVRTKALYQKKIFRRLGLFTDVTYDEAGRMVLPPLLRSDAGIDGEAVFFGGGDSFQIWSPDRFRAEYGDVPMLVRQMEQGQQTRRGAAK
jgi:MraZ protein